MNIISKAISDVKFRIPKAILEVAFLPSPSYGSYYSNPSIDEQILNNVIKARVLMDCELIGGTQAAIPLEGLPQENPTPITTVVRIPKSRTQGKSINSVLNVTFISPNVAAATMGVYGNSAGNYKPNAALQAASGALTAFDSLPIISTAKVQLLGENVILIKGIIKLTSNCYLRCVLGNDEEMSNIQLRSYPEFSKLVTYAVKAYIYNELIISMGQGQLQAGAELGVFKEIVSEYSDSEQNYTDYLRDVWERIAFMNDEEGYGRLLRLTVGGNR